MYTPYKFIQDATKIHGDKYDYSRISECDFHGKVPGRIRVLIICNTCDYRFNLNAINHIHRKSGCPNCVRSITYKEFVDRAAELYSDKYDYSLVDQTEVNGINDHCKVPIKCLICSYIRYVSIDDHLFREDSGCYNCEQI